MHPEIAGLVERERELGRVDALIETVAGGGSGWLVLEGPTGIGKTSLVAAARSRASAAGLRVLAARAGELERDYPFGVVRQWFEPALADPADRARLLAGAAALAAPAAWPAAGAAEERASPPILHGLYWLAANLAADAALLLVLDDAQWADEPSLRLLGHLAPRLEGLPVGVLVACRPPDLHEDEPLLGRLLAEPAIEVLRPTALSPGGAARLLAERLAQEPDDAFVSAALAVTGGNPFYLSELANALAAEAVAPTAAHVDRVRASGPQSLSRAVLMRVSPAARDLARALAILDEPADLGLAAALAQLDDAGGAAAADELARAGLIADDRPVELAHAIVRGAVLSGLTAAERAAGHARAARLLRERGAGPERVAAHLLATEPSGDAAVAGTLRDAALLALGRGAPEAAVRLLRRSIAEPPRDRAAVLFDLARAEAELDHGAVVEHLREVHASAADPMLRAEALRRLPWAVGMDARAHDALAGDLDHAIAEVAPLDRELALGLEEARLLGLWLAPGRRDELGARLAELGDLAGDTPGECVLLAVLARYRMDAGYPASDVAEAAVRAIGNPATLEARGPDSLWLLNCAVALAQAERCDALDPFLARALDVARARGSATGFALVSTHRAMSARRRGEPREAEAEAVAALDSGAPQDRYGLAARGLLMTALADQGRFEKARAVLERVGIGEHVPDARPLTAFLGFRGMLRHALGELEPALADLREALARIGRHATGTAAGLDARCRLVEILLALGRPEEALATADEALAIARSWGAAGALGEALRACGLVVGGEEGIAQLREAVASLDASPARLEHARALVDLGAALRRAGRRGDSREPLRAGLDYAERVGAEPLAARAREELAASGVRVPRQRVGDELTPSERRIVDMAAAGSSNPEIAQALFVTTKTVESHLANAYRKLGIRSRREL